MQLYLKIIMQCLFIILIWIQITLSKESDSEESPLGMEKDTPKLIQQPAGKDVYLRCGLKGNHADFMEASKGIVVYWGFKPCGEGYNKTSCRNDIENNNTNNNNITQWRPVLCENQQCKPTLVIKNPTENDSGLYKCLVYPYKTDNRTTLQIQVAKTFKLDIINYTIAAPEFLDENSVNVTAISESQVVLQCRIYSKVQLSIKWLRKLDNISNIYVDKPNNNFKKLETLGADYMMLASSGEKIITDDTYLTKLILNNVSEYDTGIYVCVAVNLRGFNLREMYLKVLPAINNKDSLLNNDTVDNSNEFFLLFLIPIGLAIIPLLIWLSFVISKKKNNRNNMTINNQNNKLNYNKQYISVNINIV